MLSAGLVAAQNGVAVVGGEYGSNRQPSIIVLAPGQIVSLQAAGVPSLPGVSTTEPIRATSTPLPKEPGGISVMIGRPGGSVQMAPIPIVAVQQIDMCSSHASPQPTECLVTNITLQVPFELPWDRNSSTPGVEPPAVMQVLRNGRAGPLYSVVINATKAHFARGCDGGDRRRVCAPAVTNGDGVPLRTSASLGAGKAKPGDTVIAYAYGLGRVEPPVPAGEPTPAGLHRTTLDIRVSLRWVGSDGRVTPPLAISPEFIGLVPGEIGLYQINFKLPPAPSDAAACGAGPIPQENARLLIEESGQALVHGIDEIGFCAELPQ